jgi:O-acetyl-ADP-ribose deacetylase
MRVHKRISLAGERRLLLVENDLLAEPAEVIVNAANGRLAHGGGVAAAIARAAGPALDAEGEAYVRKHGPVPVGGAVVTTAGRLKFQGVIHAVGPRWGEGDEEAKLTRAVSSALLQAHEHGWRTLSLPAISSGIFAVPFELCARAYLAGVAKHLTDHPNTTVQEVRLCLLPGPLLDLVAREMDAI